MLRGITTLKCEDCGEIFVAPDIELNAAVESCPMKCPQCGSMRTKPCDAVSAVLSKMSKLFFK